MAIQFLKKAAASVDNAISSSYLNLFVDSADGALKSKDSTGTVASLAGGGSSAGYRDIQTILTSDFNHAGPTWSDFQEATGLQTTMIANKFYQLEAHLLISSTENGTAPVRGLRVTSTGGANDSGTYGLQGGEYGNDYYSSMNLNRLTTNGVIFRNPATSDSDGIGYHVIRGLFRCGASDSTLSFLFKTTNNTESHAPTVHADSIVWLHEITE